jgi:hypothetical protein
MRLANLRDHAAVEWDALEAELESYGRDADNAALHLLGCTDMIERAARAGGLGGAEQKRCRWKGGHCAKFASAR